MNDETLGEAVLQAVVLAVIAVVLGLMAMAATNTHFVGETAKHSKPEIVQVTDVPKDHPKQAHPSS